MPSPVTRYIDVRGVPLTYHARRHGRHAMAFSDGPWFQGAAVQAAHAQAMLVGPLSAASLSELDGKVIAFLSSPLAS